MDTVDPKILSWAPFAEGSVVCPVCGDELPVPVEAAMYDDDEGRQRLLTQPVMTELWAHSWTHEKGLSDGRT